jgi:predicted nucleic acid-binding protein
VNASVLPAPTALERDPEAVDQLIVRVLSRAHRTVDAFNTPAEARAVLHVAHSFADELATLDPRFDRVQFIKVVTEDPAR